MTFCTLNNICLFEMERYILSFNDDFQSLIEIPSPRIVSKSFIFAIQGNMVPLEDDLRNKNRQDM